jgi:hypothetical protein
MKSTPTAVIASGLLLAYLPVQTRLLDHANDMGYHEELNITWRQDANDTKTIPD